jgi:hypothetical protein
MSKPTLEECQVEAVAKGMPKEEGFNFWHFYESKGWLVGKGPMKVWRSSMATWANNFHRQQTNGRTASGASKVHALRVQIQNLKEESSQIKESAPEIGGYRQVKSLPEEKRTRLSKLRELIRAKENQMATEQI